MRWFPPALSARAHATASKACSSWAGCPLNGRTSPEEIQTAEYPALPLTVMRAKVKSMEKSSPLWPPPHQKKQNTQSERLKSGSPENKFVCSCDVSYTNRFLNRNLIETSTLLRNGVGFQDSTRNATSVDSLRNARSHHVWGNFPKANQK